MKKISFLSLILFTISVATWAQDAATTSTSDGSSVLKSKRGINILPEEGEWALGVSATPFLGYMGNLFNGNNNNNAPAFDFAQNPANFISVFGKYIVDENTAYRVRFNASINSRINKAVVVQNEVTPDPLFPAFTQDWQKNNTQQIVLAAGLEKRRGSSRVQGVYGAEVILGYFARSTTYEYGNKMSLDFNAPITNSFGVGANNNIITGTPAAASVRKTEESIGTTLYAGVRGFIGVEYFIGPKISLGAEFGYSFAYASTGKTVFTTERWNPLTNSVLETKNDQLGQGNYNSFLGTDLDNLNASINLLFYF
jgi:hypothetical protein